MRCVGGESKKVSSARATELRTDLPTQLTTLNLILFKLQL